MTKTIGRGSESLLKSIDDYYQYNPDTLMPLLMLALAAQGKLSVENNIKEGTVFASINIDEVWEFDWVKLNPALKKRLREIKAEGGDSISVVGEIPVELKEIYDTFHQYDTVTVVQEYHHRKGILVHHSSNSASEKAQRQYATIFFVKKLIGESQEWLQSQFIQLADKILVESGIQPPRPRIKVAQALCTLLDYDGEGIVYNPFAGCALAGAMIGAGKNLYADGDTNDKLLAAAKLLSYGAGQQGCNIEKRDSLKWIKGVKPDYVLSTFLGYPGGKSAFDVCLRHCLEDFKETGKFAGIAAPKDIFENRSEEMKEALDRDWVDTIVLLPFGEVAVLIDAAKPLIRKNIIRFFNLNHQIRGRRSITKVLSNGIYAELLNVRDVKKKDFLKNYIRPSVERRDGCEIVSLGDLFNKLPRRVWSLKNKKEEDRVLAYIDANEKYNQYESPWMQGIKKQSVVELFSPAYHLMERCLIINSKGALEPRIFDHCFGDSYFQGALAFAESDPYVGIDYDWLIKELNMNYVFRQLHPYGDDVMVPEIITEEQVLGLKINKPILEDEFIENEDDDKLIQGSVLLGSNNVEYTIHRFLGNGNFGYAYSAGSKNRVTGEEIEVVLKEFYPHNDFHREKGKVVPDGEDSMEKYAEDREKFKIEAKIMNELGNMPNSHIVPSIDFFESETTDTMYYVMPFYQAGSFDDFLSDGEQMNEEETIMHVVIPLAKALHACQSQKVLHLDIKPENVLIDENGDAALTDFGTAKIYDDTGKITFRGGMTSSSRYAAPELKIGSMVKYDPRPDMFGIAGTIFSIITRRYPKTIMELGQDEEDWIRNTLSDANCSTQFADALVAALQGSMNLRPKNAQAFLNLFPGCEDIKL